MSTTELVKLSAAEMAAKIKAKEVSSRELVEAHLAVIESAEPSVKAFLKVSADQALEQADAFDANKSTLLFCLERSLHYLCIAFL